MKTRRISESPVVVIALMAIAVILLVIGTVGGSRAALTYSETYATELSMQDMLWLSRHHKAYYQYY